MGIPHPDGVAVVAANYGDARHPDWYHNLKANPAARVTIESDTWAATARLATPGEREEIWEKGVELYPGLTKERRGPATGKSRPSSLSGPEEHVAAYAPRNTRGCRCVRVVFAAGWLPAAALQNDLGSDEFGSST